MGQVRAAGDRAIRSGRAPEIVLEQWISGLETKRAQPRVGPGDGERDGIPKRRGPAEHGPVASAALSAAPMAKMRETVEVRGSSVVFSDAFGGTIVLARSGDRIVHLGSVAVRGPYGLSLGSLRKHGLSEAQARGVEFVAAWFGSPFDALAVNRAEGGRLLSWGFWPLAAVDVGRVLALWKQRSPASFTDLLGVYGFDVASPAEPDLAGAQLIVVDTRSGSTRRGDRALAAIAGDPRCAALLARAGRHDDAKMAQLEVALRPIFPLLRMSVASDKEREPVGVIAKSARTIAAMVLASRALDLTRIAEILASLEPGGDMEPKLLGAVLNALAETRVSAAIAVRRTLSSPELDA